MTRKRQHFKKMRSVDAEDIGEDEASAEEGSDALVAEPLTTGQRNQLHIALMELKKTLGQSLELSKDADKPVDLDQPFGRVSRIDAIQQQKMAAANRRGLEARYAQVLAALKQFDDDNAPTDYGECRICEEAISFRRLEAKPESRFCLSCQRSRERSP